MLLPEMTPEQKGGFRRRWNEAVEREPERCPNLARRPRDGRRRWSPRRTLAFVIVASLLLWALVGALGIFVIARLHF